MQITLTDEAQRYARTFARLTGVTPRDVLVEDDRLVVVVPAGRKGEAVGPDGATIDRAEDVLGATIDVVEDAPTPEAFVANALAPAAVVSVTVSRQGVAYAEVLDADRGVAIGTDGHNIETARRLVARHFELDDLQLA